MPHLLKRLELNGFKSFAQKTTLEFPVGITAIVGPNGSGKSNIIDAIRWLLGERDAKNLRGGKGEDLIFAGTPKRPRVGLGQASLSFDNHTKFFPVDFLEVTVTREITRDGTSKYFLNKAEVRLKDLQDFFAKARLGSRGLTVITQGNSDVFIRVTPKERREMIEEILGLREYQLKRTDAERRLKNAQINLEKVKALVEELAPHLRSLKRQTSRWEKRGELETELKSLETQFFGTRVHTLKKEIQFAAEALARHENGKSALDTALEKSEEHLKFVETREPEERAMLKDIASRTAVLLSDRSKLQKELGKLEAKIEFSQNEERISPEVKDRAVVLLKKIGILIRDILKGDLKEITEELKKASAEIDAIFSVSAGKSNSPTGGEKETSHKGTWEKVNRELEILEKELRELQVKERELTGRQEDFTRSFKSALHDFQSAKEALEHWQGERQTLLLASERARMHEEELMSQIRQIGRTPEDFTHISTNASSVGAHEEQKMFRLRGELASMGEVDEQVVNEARTTEERHAFLLRESADLEKAQGDLRALIKELTEKITVEFEGAVGKINNEFGKFFELMFGGGTAKLKMKTEQKEESEEEQEAEIGIDIQVGLPRKRVSSLEMLSGGERSLVGIAALFALISVSPPPFLVLDEIDAALDERNARRFAEMLKEFSKETQFVIVTHNRATMEAANVLYGVTLNDDGTSKILSLKLE